VNYSSFLVKIVEKPIRRDLKDEISVVEMLVKFSQFREKKSMRTFRIFIWGNLGNDVLKYYKTNDYVIIEGYLSVSSFSFDLDKDESDLNNAVQISVRKIYPFT
jgi:single-stranded DNA-binding protein